MSYRPTGIRHCRAVTESTVDNCIKGDFENHSFKSPSLFRHSSKDALADLCLIKRSTATVEKEGHPDQSPRKYSPPWPQTRIFAESSVQWPFSRRKIAEGRHRGQIRAFLLFSWLRGRSISPRIRRTPSARLSARAQADSGASALIATVISSAKLKSYQPRSHLIPRRSFSLGCT